MPVINPLTDQHCQCIEQVLRSSTDITDTIAALEKCGLNMDMQKQKHEAQQNFAQSVKAVLMPMSP